MTQRILVTGAGGLVGMALTARLRDAGHEVVPLASRADCDLTVPGDVGAVMRFVRPETVLHLAASVFGVGGNLSFPAEVFYRNTLMNTTMIEACHQVGVRKIVAMGSAAIYADGLSQPMQEADAMAGEPHDSEYGYAYSKRAMFAQLKAYAQQYGLSHGFSYGFVIATNMYGPHDKFDPLHGHVVPSLLKKFIDAEASGATVEIWGDGSPTRDFLYVKDAADGLLRILEQGEGAYNLATGTALPIRALVEEIAKHFPGVAYEWNIDKPLGQLQRAYDTTRIRGLGFSPAYDLARGITETVQWLRSNLSEIRQ